MVAGVGGHPDHGAHGQRVPPPVTATPLAASNSANVVVRMMVTGSPLCCPNSPEERPRTASAIANADIDGEPMSDLDTARYYMIIATAGHDTTSATIAGGFEALIENPDQLARLQADPSLDARPPRR